MTRKQLKNIAKDLLDCNEDWETTLEYRLALNYLDLEKIKFFQSMGDVARQQIMNVFDYRKGLLFGFDEIRFNDYGWLDNVNWINYEEIEIKVCKKHDKNYTGNIIKLGMGPNGKWTYGLKYQLGSGAGGGWFPSVVFGDIFNSREESFVSACMDLRKRHEESLLNNRYSHDHVYNNKVLDWIKAHLKEKQEVGQLEFSF